MKDPKTKKSPDSIHNNIEQRESNRSDISINTNLKVFNGFIGNDEFVTKLNQKNNNIKKENEENKDKINKEEKNIENKKEKEKETSKTENTKTQFFLSSLPKKDINNINRNKNIMIDILSFGNGNLLNNKSNDNSSQNSQNGAEIPQTEKNQLNNSNNSSHSSSIDKKSNNNSFENNDNNNNINSIIPPGAFMTTEGILNMNNDASSSNSNNSQNNSPHENVFSKMRHDEENIKEKNESFNKNSNLDNSKNTSGDVFYRSFNNVVDCFTVATIEKGVALLVSNDDCIFTLPTFLLPKGVKVGNVYKFAIDENEKKEDIDNEIQQMQQKFILFGKKKEKDEKK